MSTATAPDRTEAGEYYFTYIEQVPRTADICETLRVQGKETIATLRKITDEKSLYRYGPDKWSIREVIGHLSDTERVFTFRALWFARGFDAPLPSFDQNVAVPNARADERSWSSHVDELQVVRGASIAFFANLPADAWARRGIASGNPFTVRALAYIVAGHEAHHMRILRERYLREGYL